MDRVDTEKMKKIDFFWELDKDIYPPLGDELGRRDILKAAGIGLLVSIPFLLYPLITALTTLTHPLTEGTPEFYGLLIGEIIFLIFIIAAAVSCIRYYSFPVAIAGPIFLLINTGLFIIFSTDMLYSSPIIEWNWIILVPFALSFFSLASIIHNRRRFEIF